uniref:Uncharacterized protein n=1 Tax=Dunaliella tertiolecta TaxID=3047 RepID=A0A6S8M6Z7_DUNTE
MVLDNMILNMIINQVTRICGGCKHKKEDYASHKGCVHEGKGPLTGNKLWLLVPALPHPSSMQGAGTHAQRCNGPAHFWMQAGHASKRMGKQTTSYKRVQLWPLKGGWKNAAVEKTMNTLKVQNEGRSCGSSSWRATRSLLLHRNAQHIPMLGMQKCFLRPPLGEALASLLVGEPFLHARSWT